MKNKLLYLLLPFCLLSCSKKVNKPELNGLFELRLGMTIDDMMSVVDTTLLKKGEFDFSDWTGEALKEKELKRFYLDKYVIDDNYFIEKIELDFSENKLYDITTKVYNEKTEELLTQKYGLLGEEYDKVGGQWHSRKSWWTSRPFKITCGSNTISNLDHTFDRYTFYLRDDIVSNQAFKSVDTYWSELADKEQKAKEDDNQPLIERL